MSEHRYGVHDCPNGFYYLRDVTDHSVYVHRNYGYLYSPYKEDIELVSSLLNELADKVDERQDTINKLQEENEQLKQKIQRWKTLYEIKDKEVTARVDALNKVCNYYLTEIGFKSDVDPNKAVQEVINEILNTEVEMW